MRAAAERVTAHCKRCFGETPHRRIDAKWFLRSGAPSAERRRKQRHHLNGRASAHLQCVPCRNRIQAAYFRRLRERIIAAYGGGCECCGEKRYEFLALDHRHGDGAAHRREVHRKGNRRDNGRGVLLAVVREGFPNRYRILCHNCNSALGFYGHCPHEREKEIAV